MSLMNIKNIAIIAHVDHGKTTLVDKILKQYGNFRDNQVIPDRVMDSNTLEKERGITILSKNTSIIYKQTKINIVDTPGHADFSGEVERIVNMVDGVLLLVDAFEGPMPQTRFVLRKALEAGLQPLVVINKIDRPNARPDEVVDEVLDLFIELEADDKQLDFPVVYASAREGYAKTDIKDNSQDVKPLLDSILHYIPSPAGDLNNDLQIVVSSLEHDEYVGRIGVGKIYNGRISEGQEVILCNTMGKKVKVKPSNLFVFEGLQKVKVDEAYCGDIIGLAGIDSIYIGDTICSLNNIKPVPFINVDEPTISMNFLVNDSPMAGLEGTYVTSRHIKERLNKELWTDISLKIEELSPESFEVSGRGELHLSILIETMRREGYEFAVTKPQVIFKKENDTLLEPMENLFIEVPEEYVGTIIESCGKRKGELVSMENITTSTIRLEFLIPARGLIGYRTEFLTDTKGNGIMNHTFAGYADFKGEMNARSRGSLVAHETGTAVTYGLHGAQERGALFITPGTEVYAGMIVGENSRTGDITVNVCRKKQLTNTRASGSDDALRLVPPIIMSLENCLEFIADDELLEVTPKSLRLRKAILDKNARERAEKNKTHAS